LRSYPCQFANLEWIELHDEKAVATELFQETRSIREFFMFTKCVRDQSFATDVKGGAFHP
jgi:hypothetical protein